MDNETRIKLEDTISSGIKAKAPLRRYKSTPDMCMGCGTCSAGCPMTGVDGFDPRKILRFVNFGMVQLRQGVAITRVTEHGAAAAPGQARAASRPTTDR